MKTFEVTAKEPGFIHGEFKQKGEVFTVTEDELGTWMEKGKEVKSPGRKPAQKAE